jgi:hypothetical protein
MKHLIEYVKQINATNRMFCRNVDDYKPLNINSANDRKEIRDHLEGDLSPENLCCDGELRGRAVEAKSRLLHGALKELEAL